MQTMRGILGFAGYVPYNRLDRTAITQATGTDAGKGSRSVASYDEDTTTMAVEAARLALRPLGDPGRGAVTSLWLSTTSPAYLDRTNATAVHAALRLDRGAGAFDANGSVRSGIGALRACLSGSGASLHTSADVRSGLPTSADERAGGDGAAALLVGDDALGLPVLAEFLGGASLTEEFVDRWRAPGETVSQQWEERFGEMRYVPLGQQAWAHALAATGLEAPEIARVVVAGTHARAVRQVSAKITPGTGGQAEDLLASVGNPGAAQPALLLAHALEHARPGEVIALVVLADGADVLVFRATEALGAHVPARSVAGQVAAGRAGLRYVTFLAWNSMLTLEPPRRPEPARASSSAAARGGDWKFGLVGSRDRSSGAVHLPPARVSFRGGALDDMEPLAMADATGSVLAFTIDRLAYSPSPPIVFAVIDFDQAAGAARLPMELTDMTPEEISSGTRVEMTFRRLNAADGIQNYFWKAKPIRGDS